MRLKEGSSQTFQAPVSVHAAQGSHVYMFKNNKSDSEDSSEEEFDVMELRARGRDQQGLKNSKDRPGDVMLLEREITEEDNLNKLALQYGCKVADIKRVNNFIREQDIYALKSIKIPVKPNGILTEGRGELRPLQPTVSSFGLKLVESPEVEMNSRADPTEYFKEIDQNIEAAVQSTEHSSATFPSDPVTGFSPGSFPEKTSTSGADCGIRWWNAVLFMLLIGIVLPVFYIVYFKTQEEGSPAKETQDFAEAPSSTNVEHLWNNTTIAYHTKTVS